MTEHDETLLEAPERVLSTLNPDGSRLWIRPKAAMGPWWRRRRTVAWTLMVLFTLVPWLQLNGNPLFRLDLAARQLHFLGAVFRPTDSLLLVLLFLSIFIGVFLITALVGRAWCGWACPQTVYLEFLFRPLERLIEGQRAGRPRREVPLWRRALKWTVFAVLALHLANTFLAYFAGPREVLSWSFGSPAEHPAAFAVVLVVTLMILYDFGFFREQLCTLVCPYARLQSALLDRESLTVGYDPGRGEPRARGRRADGDGKGDCIDCSLCVAACPTGIDIRDGLQLECVACTQCIDACDAVMDKVGKPQGLIRYASQNSLEGTPRTQGRWRVLFYPALLTVLVGGLVFLLLGRESALVRVLRVQNVPYAVLEDGRVQNMLRLRVENRAEEERTYLLEFEGGSEVRSEAFPLTVAAGVSQEIVVPVATPGARFGADGRAELRFTVADGVDFERAYAAPVLGPAGEGEGE